MSNIRIYTRPQCHFCQKLKGFLDEKGLSYEELNVAASPELQAEMESRTNGVGSVPQLFVGDQHTSMARVLTHPHHRWMLLGIRTPLFTLRWIQKG